MFLNNRGFSFVEVLIAAGIFGLMGITIIKLAKNQSEVIQKSKIDMEIAAIDQEITLALLNRHACKNTFNGASLLADGSAGSDISVIRNEQNNVITIKEEVKPNIYEDKNIELFSLSSTSYANKLIQIKKMTIENFKLLKAGDIATPGDQAGLRSGIATLNILYERPTAQIKDVMVSHMVEVVLHQSNDTVVTCEDDGSLAMAATRKRLCLDLGGTLMYDGSGARICVASFQVTKNEIKKTLCVELGGTFVDTPYTTTSTGSFGGTLNSSNVTCRPMFAGKVCVGKVVGFSTAGGLECAP